jgi:hypothetical protein
LIRMRQLIRPLARLMTAPQERPSPPNTTANTIYAERHATLATRSSVTSCGSVT